MMLAILIRLYRETNQLSIRQMAKKMDIDHVSLWRFEEGRPVDYKTMKVILRWLLL